MYRQLATESCRTSSKIYRWRNLLVFAMFTVFLGVVKNSMAMPQREYGSVERVTMTRTTYRENREPFDEDEEEPIQSGRFPENRSGRGESRSRDERRDNYPRTTGRHREIEIEQRNNFIAAPEPACRGRTFCEESNSYPEDYIRNIISDTSSLNLLSGVDSDVDVGNRFGPSDGEIVCESEVKVVFPKKAQTNSDEWLFVVQDPSKGFKQGVRVENCNTGTSMGTCQIIGSQVPGYQSSCKQKYISRVMAAIGKNGTAVMEKFTMPSSCCCEIKINFSSRIAGELGNNQSPAPPRRRGRGKQ